MKHLKDALNSVAENKLGDKKVSDFLSVKGNKLTIEIQDGVISENGINGVQITDVLEYVKEVFESLNADFRCRENALTITKIEEALHWRDARTKDRLKRKVEGKSKV